MEKVTDERLIILGERLKTLRKEHGLTQDDVATQLQMERTSISKYEHGVLEPPLCVARKLAKLYNTDLEFFIYDKINCERVAEEKDKFDSIELPYAELTKSEKTLILKMRLMSEQEKQKIYELLNS